MPCREVRTLVLDSLEESLYAAGLAPVNNWELPPTPSLVSGRQRVDGRRDRLRDEARIMATEDPGREGNDGGTRTAYGRRGTGCGDKDDVPPLASPSPGRLSLKIQWIDGTGATDLSTSCAQHVV